MPTNLDLTIDEFDALHAAADTKRRVCRVPTDLMKKLLRDHSRLVARLEPSKRPLMAHGALEPAQSQH